jgi:hypothetical protein
MKITLAKNFLAVLQTEHGEIIALIGATEDAKASLEEAVSQHYDCECGLTNPKDFHQLLDHEESYRFVLYGYGNNQEDVYETFTMTYAPLY